VTDVTQRETGGPKELTELEAPLTAGRTGIRPAHRAAQLDARRASSTSVRVPNPEAPLPV
jgi:hypothetical protein